MDTLLMREGLREVLSRPEGGSSTVRMLNYMLSLWLEDEILICARTFLGPKQRHLGEKQSEQNQLQ